MSGAGRATAEQPRRRREPDGCCEPAAATGDLRARYGTADTPPQPATLTAGALQLNVVGGAVRRVTFAGTEVVRGIDMPVRDANWATLPTRTRDETVTEDETGFLYRRSFDVADGLFTGTFTLEGAADPATLTAIVELIAGRATSVNRAGFVVLHPLKGVSGTELVRTTPDGSVDVLAFPATVSPSQPVFDIAVLSHTVAGVGVTMAFEGEVFEMEDQRNWTDASYKTYCRPLALPRPFPVEAGERIVQRIEIAFAPSAGSTDAPAAAGADSVTMPDIEVALDEATAPLREAHASALALIPFSAAQVRLTPETAADALAAAAPLGLPLALEVVLPADADPAALLEEIAEAAADANIARVQALPETYLASHQPEGPWPAGATPAEATAAAQAAFPAVEIVAGMLTNFTEFNRCPPEHASHSVAFGTTAIVHAADDASVLETLEALPAVFETAMEHAADRTLRLGLTTIGMRSNPYGAAVADNPARGRVAMAMDDPRHGALFAAAFAVGIAAHAARAGVASLAPAMASGPLGLVAEDGSVSPLFHVVRALAHLSGETATVAGDAPGGLVEIRSEQPGLAGIAANLGDAPAVLDAGTVVVLDAGAVDAAAQPDWLANAPRVSGPVPLQPLDVAFLVTGDVL